MIGGAGAISSAVEIGPTETFADERRDDPNRECALSPPVACLLSTECPAGHECSRGTCLAFELACTSHDDCAENSICRLDLWPSNHLGVRTSIDFIPEPGVAGQLAAALLAIATLRARMRRLGTWAQR